MSINPAHYPNNRSHELVLFEACLLHINNGRNILLNLEFQACLKKVQALILKSTEDFSRRNDLQNTVMMQHF